MKIHILKLLLLVVIGAVMSCDTADTTRNSENGNLMVLETRKKLLKVEKSTQKYLVKNHLLGLQTIMEDDRKL